MEKIPDNNSQELRKIREAKGLSLEDLFKQTRVRVVYLEAIENEDFHLLPVPVYAKNFIKIYARSLGIKSESIIKKYEDYLNQGKEIQALAAEDELEKKHVSEKVTGRRTYLSIVFVLTAVIIISWIVSRQYESSSDMTNSSNTVTNAIPENKVQDVTPVLGANDTATGQAEANPVVEQNKKNKQLPAEMKTNLSSTGSENNDAKPLRKTVSLPVENMRTVSDGSEASLLVIKATEETWIRIKADQNPSFQIVLKPGEKVERRAANFNVDIGNAGGVKVQFKGKNVEDLGKAGEVVHLRLP